MPSLEEIPALYALTAPGRGPSTPTRLAEHLKTTVTRLRQFGIGRGDCVASVLPNGPDSHTAQLAVSSLATFAPFEPGASRAEYECLLLELGPKLLLMHPGAHPAREAAQSLGVPVANVLRHFEAGIFTLESALSFPTERQGAIARHEIACVPLVFIGSGLAYRRIARHLGESNRRCTVIGITPPELDHLPPPHTIEHIAAECVRMLRRYRPDGPYALSGWRTDGLVALEMARLLESAGEPIPFVALIDARDLFTPQVSPVQRAVGYATQLAKRCFGNSDLAPHRDLAAEALRQYRPHSWYGRMLQISPAAAPRPRFRDPWSAWRRIVPQGFVYHESPGESAAMLSEPNVSSVAEILAVELDQSRITVSR